MQPARRRGPYKRHLEDIDVQVPRTTAWRRRQQQMPVAGVRNELENNPPVNWNNNPLDEDLSESDIELSIDSSTSDEDQAGNDTDMSSEVHEDRANSLRSFSQNSDISNTNTESEHSVEDEELDEEFEDLPQEDIGANNDMGDRIPEIQMEAGRGEHLYNGCRITAEESSILIMAFIIRWGLEEKSIEHLLQLIDCHLPSSVLGSKYMFLKNFPMPDIRKIRYTCPECCSLLPQNEEPEFECECGEHVNVNDLKESGNFFVQLSVSEQLKKILCNDTLRARMRKDCEERDVIMGGVYRRLRENGIIGDDDITLQWNTDGLKPYKSAKGSVWPIQACINELKYSDRKENMILCGLYYGKKKPDINSFLAPFVEELELLHNEGIECNIPGRVEPMNVKVHTLLASVDSVARPMLQGIHQFNGEYGCSYCLHPGEQIERGRGRARVYPGEMRELRTREQHLNALSELEEYNRANRPEKTHIEGVKAPTVLLMLSNFCIISSFTPDYLHSVLEGCVLTFIKHWSDANYSDELWYLTKRKRTILSEKLTAILPPVEITRPPRGLSDLELLKASELRSFLLYYSLPCLKGLLPDRYLRHWFLFVYGISTFLRSKISQEEFIKAKNALFKFVYEISTVYPDCTHLYTFNVHLMLHVPRSVENYGALWASSTFPYEHFNGVLARLLTGTRSVPEQITRSFLRLRRVSELGSRVFSRPNCCENGKKFFQKVLSKFRANHNSQLFGNDLRLFGSPENYDLSVLEKVLVRQLLGIEGDDIVAQSYRRCIFKGTVFHASFYEALTVRDNSTVALNDGRLMYIKRILVVQEHHVDAKYCMIIGEEIDVLREEICHDRDLNLSSTELVKVCHRSGRTVCVRPRTIDVKCVAIPYGDQVCVARIVNPVERD